MPKCGSQIYLCDLPIRFDTYNGCSHGCKYCFAKKFTDISKIKGDEGPKALLNFIEGKRNIDTNWCDWDIPIHWGGLSDPFQPCEKTRKISLECLKIFAETKYPFVVSTKGKLILEEPYLSLISRCNCVVQISTVCSIYDKLEPGAPSYEERLNMARVLSKKVKRVIIRIQPYMHEVFNEVFNNLKDIADAGVYGIVVEGMKFQKKKPGLVKIAGDFSYPYELIKQDFLKLKEEAHRVGLKIYAGENRIRALGDSLTCCGIDGLEGFKGNNFNLNHILNNDEVDPTKNMKQKNTGYCFSVFSQKTASSRKLKGNSFAFNMIDYYKEHKEVVDIAMGVKKK